MARNYRKERGRETEHLVAAAFAADGWPFAEATGAGSPGRDIKGVIGVAPEVKARREFSPLPALRQAARNAAGDLPVVVMRPDGCGPSTIDDWPAFLTFGDLRRLLRQAGYGNPLPAEPAPATVPPFRDERLPRDASVVTVAAVDGIDAGPPETGPASTRTAEPAPAGGTGTPDGPAPAQRLPVLGGA